MTIIIIIIIMSGERMCVESVCIVETITKDTTLDGMRPA